MMAPSIPSLRESWNEHWNSCPSCGSDCVIREGTVREKAFWFDDHVQVHAKRVGAWTITCENCGHVRIVNIEDV